MNMKWFAACVFVMVSLVFGPVAIRNYLRDRAFEKKVQLLRRSGPVVCGFAHDSAGKIVRDTGGYEHVLTVEATHDVWAVCTPDTTAGKK